MKGIEWKTIKEFENYEVSSNGDIKRICSYDKNKHLRKEKILKPRINKCGYLYVILTNNEIRKTLTVHRLIAKAFIPNPENKPQVNHINGIKTDNRIENLEWVTNQENVLKRYEIGIVGNNYKSVSQYDKNNRLIRIYKNSYEAEKETGINRGQIGACCRKVPKYKTAGGYIWQFTD